MPHPLGAVASIQEDPVRLLRTYRFASRYGFELDDSIHDAEDANRLFKATPPGRVLFEVKKSLLLHNRPSQFLAHLAGPSEVHRHLFEAAGAATLDPWQACVGKVGRLEALVLDGVGRGILTARSVQWRGRRPDSTQAGLLAPDWRKSGVWEADWVELLLGALLWRCSRDAVQKVGAALQLSHRMVENVLVLQGQARQKQISKQTAPPGVHLLRCAVASGETFDEFWDRWPKENAGHDASARG
ncbi:unnamed protein product [Prorocentrum cordatum]|uniref:Uncharacterized protein n=1 Tax=Prorocentrum cordatum TaxID=2364126 RepID=A0ABN9T3Q8_9DINO|nr:unnamed protein product [Polarella glacialis]